MKKELSSKHKVRFQDCDPFNHLNNSKYIDYFINAREDQIDEHYQLNVFDYAKKTGHAWVVSSNQIAYLKPAKTMEDVIIDTKLIHYDERSLTAEMMMYDEKKTHLKSIFWIKFFYINLQDGKIAAHPTKLLSLFEEVILPVEDRLFEQRLHRIRN